jgi:G3E family GTPase
MTGRAPLPFHVVTGFLGAGKTTLINRLLRAPDLGDALVMVNEWGAIGLDNLLYERLAGDAILVNGGCVCCALRGDLIDALRDALARRDCGALPRFGRIVLETTGLAEPAPILHALFADPGLATRLVLAGVTTVVDAVNGAATVAARAEGARQVALADRLVVAKTDLWPQADRAARFQDATTALRALNPVAPILDGAAGEFLASDFLGMTGALPAETGPSASAAAHRVKTFVFRSEAALDPVAFAQFLSVLGAMLGPRLLRLKGLFKLADRPETPILVDGVQHVFHPPRILPRWSDADRSSRAVLIVEGVAAREAETLWAALTGTPRIDAPDLAALVENPLAPKAGGLLG